MPVTGMDLASQMFDISRHFQPLKLVRDDQKFNNRRESLSKLGEKDAHLGSFQHFLIYIPQSTSPTGDSEEGLAWWDKRTPGDSTASPALRP